MDHRFAVISYLAQYKEKTHTPLTIEDVHSIYLAFYPQDFLPMECPECNNFRSILTDNLAKLLFLLDWGASHINNDIAEIVKENGLSRNKLFESSYSFWCKELSSYNNEIRGKNINELTSSNFITVFSGLYPFIESYIKNSCGVIACKKCKEFCNTLEDIKFHIYNSFLRFASHLELTDDFKHIKDKMKM